MNQDYLTVLVTELRCHKSIKSEPQLSSEIWNKSGFELCSKIISNTLLVSFSEKDMFKYGTSISYKTLQSIFRRRYTLKYPIDPRSLSTLTKLVRFLGYNNWTDFINKTNQNTKKAAKTEEAQLVNFIKGAVNNSFEAISDLTTCALETYFDSQHSAFKMLNEVITHNKSNKNIINNPTNPSTVEILDIEVENIDDRTARVKTKEYWLLCWWNKEQNKYTTRLKDINDHMYTLIKDKQNWRIMNDVTLSDKYELQTSENK